MLIVIPEQQSNSGYCGCNCYTGCVVQSAEAGGHVEQEEPPEPEHDDSAATSLQAAAGLGAGTDFGKGAFM